jgi:O-antigen/teichoic acid export membrane protein
MVLPKLAIGMWVGPDYTYLSPLVTLYCLHIFLTMLVGVSSTMFVGMNQVGQVLSISIWAAVINIVISTFTVQRLGIQGLILGTTIAYLISSAIYIRATGKIFKIGVTSFLRQTIRPVALAACGSLIVILAFRIFSHSTSLWLGLCALGLSYLLFGVIFMRWGISKEELLPILSVISRRKSPPTV